jgi:hypothetical protein
LVRDKKTHTKSGYKPVDETANLRPTDRLVKKKLHGSSDTILARHVSRNGWTSSLGVGTNQPNGWAITRADGASLQNFDMALKANALNNQLLSGGLSFCAADAQNFTELSSVFDEFRILKIEFTLECRSNCFQSGWVNTGTVGSLIQPIAIEAPYLYIVEDPNNADLAPSVASLLEYSKTRRFSYADGRKFTYTLHKPRVDMVAYSESVAGYKAGVSSVSPWLSCTDASFIPHYGLKFILQLQDTASSPSIGELGNQFSCPMSINVKYTFEFRSIR